MENKSLNVFNTSCVCASPATATDADFERVQAALLNAARRMADDGWWWPASGGAIKWSIGKELLKGMVPSFLTSRSTAKGA